MLGLSLVTLRRSILALSLGTCAVSFATTTTTLAVAQSTTATDFVKTKHANVTKLLKTPKTAERDKKIETELLSLVDFDELAKAAAGTQWDKRSEAEKTEFVDLLRQVIMKEYKKQVDQTLAYDVTYKAEVAQGTDFLVKTEASNPKDIREIPVTINYLVRKKGSGFVVVDVLPEGSSTVKRYNSDIANIVKKDGWPAVIKKLKAQLTKS